MAVDALAYLPHMNMYVNMFFFLVGFAHRGCPKGCCCCPECRPLALLLVVGCWLLVVGCWLLFVVCCLLFVVCCLLFAVCCLLFVVVVVVVTPAVFSESCSDQKIVK